MKPKKIIDKFYFLEDGAPLFDGLKPIKLTQQTDLIDRIYKRYPYLNRGHLTLVVHTILTTLRELVLQGHIIVLRPLLPHLRLYVFPHIKDNITYPAVKVKVGTPQTWKERPSWIKRLKNLSM